jgi:hypothetical protein
MAVDPADWLRQWTERNLPPPNGAPDKASVRDAARTCAEDAASAGISIAELKQAAGGDVETYLVHRQNEGSANVRN